jgi:uncharacterized short protein YbdD (DUF466 family)
MSFEPVIENTLSCRAPVRSAARRWVRAVWTYLRAVSGDDAYERYIAHHAAAHAGEPAMSRKAFFADSQRHKWTGVTRCC